MNKHNLIIELQDNFTLLENQEGKVKEIITDEFNTYDKATVALFDKLKGRKVLKLPQELVYCAYIINFNGRYRGLIKVVE
jgi:hypothetical protein